ncbi:MAG TPA: hypothetical protein VGF28_04380 [Thermoanaerobaculia bacterium]|jgi:hypothetical protein
MNTKENTVNTAAAEEPVANRFTPDAQERIARLRTMTAEFPDDDEPKTLTVSEIRLARGTSLAALEKAALFAEAVPDVGHIANVRELRDAIGFELAYGGVRDEARVLARRVDMAILRRKLKVAKMVRALFRMANGYVTLDAGDVARPHVAELKRTLVRPRRKKVTSEPEAVAKK